MANEEQRTPGEDPNADEVPAQEPESQDSGSSPQSDLTVDDILGAEQSDAAADVDAANEAAAGNEADNPYLDDLRRLTAEYANYRKRTESNAAVEKQRAIAAAVSPMLTVLDDLDRAEKHGDLAEGTAFATIAQKIRGTFERIGVQSFGETGEVFDPQIHEAIAQVPVPGTEQHTVLDVIERGYRIGEVELRPAKVAVAVGADG
ncbi:nucleotide exchange factor GrpE [Leucobacter manosquensis]|uniref:Protein GrpE n=1 Tax=Leucobacter manosquensis TaxID=2810611 RepID=A0ABS5M717_9MICO|nr:nucleotide exchange factor GrpE [Leucobacter manosquensis]MBS3182974.1 nucleotide exchange factor GrpE [Leucobacter manosquensis]